MRPLTGFKTELGRGVISVSSQALASFAEDVFNTFSFRPQVHTAFRPLIHSREHVVLFLALYFTRLYNLYPFVGHCTTSVAVLSF